MEPEVLQALASTDLRLITSPNNVGLGRGLNQVVETAACHGFTHVMLLDQDSEPPPGLLEALVERFSDVEHQGNKIAVLAPRLVPPEQGFYKPIRYEWRCSTQGTAVAAVDFAPTSGSLISTAAFAEIGPFREDFFIAGIDVEWGFRAWQRGWSSFIASDLAMPHRWGEAVSEDELGKAQILRHSPIRNYYYARNIVAVARLPHVPSRWRIRSCANLAAQIALLAVKGSPGSLNPVWTGLKDGFHGRLGPAPSELA
jgi:rhamnosyltransferase